LTSAISPSKLAVATALSVSSLQMSCAAPEASEHLTSMVQARSPAAAVPGGIDA